jgi:excisionase family DNA binding protein
MTLADVLSPKQTAQELGVSKTRLQQLVAAARLPFIDTPNGRLFRREDVERFKRIPRPTGRPRKGAA